MWRIWTWANCSLITFIAQACSIQHPNWALGHWWSWATSYICNLTNQFQILNQFQTLQYSYLQVQPQTKKKPRFQKIQQLCGGKKPKFIISTTPKADLSTLMFYFCGHHDCLPFQHVWKKTLPYQCLVLVFLLKHTLPLQQKFLRAWIPRSQYLHSIPTKHCIKNT